MIRILTNVNATRPMIGRLRMLSDSTIREGGSKKWQEKEKGQEDLFIRKTETEGGFKDAAARDKDSREKRDGVDRLDASNPSLQKDPNPNTYGKDQNYSKDRDMDYNNKETRDRDLKSGMDKKSDGYGMSSAKDKDMNNKDAKDAFNSTSATSKDATKDMQSSRDKTYFSASTTTTGAEGAKEVSASSNSAINKELRNNLRDNKDWSKDAASFSTSYNASGSSGWKDGKEAKDRGMKDVVGKNADRDRDMSINKDRERDFTAKRSSDEKIDSFSSFSSAGGAGLRDSEFPRDERIDSFSGSNSSSSPSNNTTKSIDRSLKDGQKSSSTFTNNNVQNLFREQQGMNQPGASSNRDSLNMNRSAPISDNISSAQHRETLKDLTKGNFSAKQQQQQENKRPYGKE